MPVSPFQVEQQLTRLSACLESKTDELGHLLQTAAEADVKFKVEHSKALLRSRAKTAGQREAEAIVDCADLLMAKRTSEAIADACRESVRSIRDQLSAAQTVANQLRAEMQWTGRGAA